MPHEMLPHNHGHESHTADLQAQLAKVQDFHALSDLFAQVGDPTRLRIFWLLCHCEECVINIAALMDMSSPAVSHHLRSLRECGLIVSRREGKEVFYQVAHTPTTQLLHYMIEQAMAIHCPE